jgi:hypothetical protein
MSNNPIDQPQSGKHVCIFELERKGALFTAEVVCTVCGAYLSAGSATRHKTRPHRDLRISEMISIKFTRAAVTAVSLSIAGLLFAAPTSDARSQSESPSPKTVTGQVSAVEGEFHMAKNARGEDTLKIVDKVYIITTPTGEEIR